MSWWLPSARVPRNERRRAAFTPTQLVPASHHHSQAPLTPPLFFRLPCARVATDRQDASLHCALHLGGGSCISLLLFSGVFGRVGEITAREAQTAWPTKKKSIEKRGEGREPGYTEREDRRASESASAKPPRVLIYVPFSCFALARLCKGAAWFGRVWGENLPRHTHHLAAPVWHIQKTTSPLLTPDQKTDSRHETSGETGTSKGGDGQREARRPTRRAPIAPPPPLFLARARPLLPRLAFVPLTQKPLQHKSHQKHNRVWGRRREEPTRAGSASLCARAPLPPLLVLSACVCVLSSSIVVLFVGFSAGC